MPPMPNEANLKPELSKKERREQKRKERQGEVSAQQRKGTFVSVIKWLSVVLFIAFIVVGIFIYLRRQAPASAPGEFIPEMSREHIQLSSSHAAYTSNPPTSGPHYEKPKECGIYTQELVDEEVVHTLEHGAVWITYKPGLDQRYVEILTKIAKEYSKVVLSPRSANSSDVAVVSWTRIFKISSNDFSQQAIEDFIKSWRNRAPENVPC